jgi:hypothetical protein
LLVVRVAHIAPEPAAQFVAAAARRRGGRLRQIGLALGGQAGARLAQQQHLPTSPHTLLRLPPVARALTEVAGALFRRACLILVNALGLEHPTTQTGFYNFIKLLLAERCLSHDDVDHETKTQMLQEALNETDDDTPQP